MSWNILITSNDKCDQSRNSFNSIKEKIIRLYFKFDDHLKAGHIELNIFLTTKGYNRNAI